LPANKKDKIHIVIREHNAQLGPLPDVPGESGLALLSEGTKGDIKQFW
jgi:hypothetical protein